jgi:hypothetical protein
VPIIRIVVNGAASHVHYHTTVRPEWLRVLSWQHLRPFGADAADSSLPAQRESETTDIVASGIPTLAIARLCKYCFQSAGCYPGLIHEIRKQ